MHGHVALDYRLAAQPRVELEIGGLFHTVHLVVFHLGKVIEALFRHHMAGSAGAASAAGMFEMETEVHGYVQERFRQPMSLIRQLAGLELERLIGGKKSYLGHTSIVAVGI